MRNKHLHKKLKKTHCHLEFHSKGGGDWSDKRDYISSVFAVALGKTKTYFSISSPDAVDLKILTHWNCICHRWVSPAAALPPPVGRPFWRVIWIPPLPSFNQIRIGKREDEDRAVEIKRERVIALLWKIQTSNWIYQRTLTYFVRGSITVSLTSCLPGLDLADQVNLLLIKHKQSNRIKTSQTGGAD